MWIKIKDELPESKQEVLVYWCDEPFGNIHQIHLLTYFKKGDDIGWEFKDEIANPEARLLDAISNRNNRILAEEDGFYICEGETHRRHADIITHWMPLPKPPKIFLDELEKK